MRSFERRLVVLGLAGWVVGGACAPGVATPHVIEGEAEPVDPSVSPRDEGIGLASAAAHRLELDGAVALVDAGSDPEDGAGEGGADDAGPDGAGEGGADDAGPDGASEGGVDDAGPDGASDGGADGGGADGGGAGDAGPDAPDAPTGCLVSGPSWQGAPIPPQSGRFVLTFDAVPAVANADALTTLSLGAPAAFVDAAIAIRFNAVGTIDVRDGGAYGAATVVPYVAGRSYRFRAVVDVPARRYSVRVSEDGGTELLLAHDFAFRTEQGDVTALDHLGVWAVGSHVVCDPEFGPAPDDPPPGPALTPVGRWDTVPYQRIDAGQTLRPGVVAFSKHGISHVRFEVPGLDPVDVGEMTVNPDTGVVEYWFPLGADAFVADGPVEVYATVHGLDGGVRVLPPLPLVVVPNGSLPRPEAWVHPTSGNDASAAVNVPGSPFASIGRALSALRDWRAAHGLGADADGGIVRLLPGTHTLRNGGLWSGVPTTDEWVTITRDPARGGTRENTILGGTAGGEYVSADHLRVVGLTLHVPGSNQPFFQTGASDEKHFWLEDSVVVGSGRYDLYPDAVGQNYRWKYFTESAIRDVRYGQGVGHPTELARNLTLERVGEDAFANAPMIVNVSLDDHDPGPAGGYEWHADAWQSPGITTAAPAPENYIVYNYRGTDLHYQAIFGRVKELSANNAFVNVLMEMRAPVRDYGPGNAGVGSWLGGMYDHLLLWHCTFIGSGTGHDFYFANEGYTGTPLFQMTNSSFRGNLFTRWLTTEPPAWTEENGNEFVDNHYVIAAGALTFTPDTADGPSTGDPDLVTDVSSADFGRPRASSPLAGVVAVPPVGYDLAGSPRGPNAAIGAYNAVAD